MGIDESRLVELTWSAIHGERRFFEAKTHLSQLLERVAQGEELTITKHGKPVARLVPATTTKPKPAVRAAVEAMKRFRRGQTLGGLNIREMIEEGRKFSEKTWMRPRISSWTGR